MIEDRKTGREIVVVKIKRPKPIRPITSK